LKHSNVRTSKASRAVLTRVSTIGAWHLMQGWLSILVDAKQSSGSDNGKSSIGQQQALSREREHPETARRCVRLQGHVAWRWSKKLTFG
jgi:hypothetical protein